MAPKRPSTSTADSSAALPVSSEANARRSTRSSLGGTGGATSSPTKYEEQTKTSSNGTKDKKGEEAQLTSKDAEASKVGAGKASQAGEAEQAAEEAEPAAKKAKKDGVYKRNDIIEDIVLQDENDSPVSLKSLYDASGTSLVIFSYPRANTPGCTNQACGYRDIHAEFIELGFQVVGLSTDKPGAQMNWKKAKNLPYTLLSDPKKELLSRLGATDAKKRCHWVIEKGGRLAEQDIGVKPASDPTNALNIAKALASTTKGKPAQK
ncbi:BZ3500_MvSof-1268-A1-R1_Chr2-1g04463 [Microbotryum saponariae]|uniref:thioredoxin-dependent peroxiredoxin n=1 Tax=Microbotryum saponariae TaxID=289078 RepID=A0A2X0KFA5_9BASI|nr:BZ3500_MvSof-1268-A1-R1_Chr2-1g04463 [Microbotryum saponariae]SCZ91779.1 BZ3501_MvSof-1269-A2-R1_Chr2-1g04119 [Microbotryum saponariae]